ncbi:MAG: hypothetical protein ACRCYO_08725 [Bacteroidia bacterium]
MAEKFLRTWILPLFAFILIYTSSSFRWHGPDKWRDLIQNDAQGYYAYLPAVFVHNDPHFRFFDSVERRVFDSAKFYDYRSYQGNQIWVNKYYCGTAICESPLVLPAYFIDWLHNDTSIGWSKIDFIAVQLSAILWVCVALIFLRKLLQRFGASPPESSVLAVLIVAGTNLFYYIVGEPGLSHPFAFAVCTLFLYYSDKWLRKNSRKGLVLAAFFYALLLIIRPVDGLIILWLPYAAGSFGAVFTRIGENFRKPIGLFLAALAFCIPILPQLLYYKIATGNWWIYSYNGETFDFANPEFLNFLFSYKKGMFLYTPLLFIALFGFIPLFKQSVFRATYLFILIALIVYVLCSWWMWFYGGSYGCRVIIDFLPLFALLLLALWKSIQPIRWLKVSTLVLVALIFMLNMVQTMQYRYTIIHWSEMTQEKYWDVFLKLKK